MSSALGDDVDIVILNWRTAAMSAATARAAAAALPGAAIYLVDNGSGDGSPDEMRRLAPTATVVETGRNLGFGAGMNAGIRAGTRPLVLLSNSDARPEGDCFRLLVEHCHADPGLGCLGPMIIDDAGQPVPQLPPEPAAWKLVASPLPGISRFATDPAYAPPMTAPERIPWIPALCAAMFRRAALESIGGFDPSYFLGWEEWDLTRRLRDAGWAMGLHPEAVIRHQGRGSTPGDLNAWRTQHSRKAIVQHLTKWHGPVWGLLGKATWTLRGWIPRETTPGR